jgi:hypothetical protein
MYIFQRIDEEGVLVKSSNNLKEFLSFCHYASNTDEECIKAIEYSLEEDGIYWFNGNDVWYAVMQHSCWKDLNELTLEISK